MFSSYLRISVVFLILNSVQLAPVEEKSLFDIISSDVRAEKLKSKKFVKSECARSQSLCYALYDISLRFYESKLEFVSSSSDYDEEICSKLVNVLPEKPIADENIQKLNTTWIKDVFKQNASQCLNTCIYESIDDDYNKKVKPACFFIYNQYQFLASQSTKHETTASKSGEDTKSSENSNNAKPETKPKTPITQDPNEVLEETVAAIGPILLPANAVNLTKTSNETQPQPPLAQSTVVKAPAVKSTEKKDEKPATLPVAAVTVNKSETAQVKVETTKTESSSLVGDLESALDDKDVFNNEQETQSDLPEKDIETDIDGEDDDAEVDYSPDLVRDNNHNMGNSNKFNHLPLTDVDAPESESRVRVEKVLGEFEDNPDSNFFTYLCIVMFLSISLYILYHNRHKLLALCIEGRRGSRRPRERSRGGSKAAYSKLDCNLEEAITSKKSLSGKTLDIIY